jgi:hypothetical protein
MQEILKLIEPGREKELLEKALSDLENVEVKSIFNGKVLVLMIGINDFLDSKLGWTMRGVYDQASLNEKEYLKSLLDKVSRVLNLSALYAPVSVSQNGLIVGEDEHFKHELEVNNRVCLYRGLDREGLFLNEGQAFVVSPADCHTLVLQDEYGNILASHMGRNSQVDLNNPERKSVIENAIESLKINNKNNGLETDVRKIKMWVGNGIHYLNYLHPIDGKYGEQNKKRNDLIRNKLNFHNKGMFGEIDVVQDGYYDVNEFAIAEAKRLGLPPENITIDMTVDTAGDVCSKENPMFYSNTKGTGRNLVIVINL